MKSRSEPSPEALGVPEPGGNSDVYDTHYRLVVQNAPDYAIFTMDLEGIIRTWNPAAARIMGYTEAEIVGQTAALIFTAEDRAAGVPEREMRAARETGKAEDVRWHLRKDGSRFWANGIMTALNDDSGQCVGLAKIVSDATQRKQMEDALRQSEQRFRQAIEQLPLSTQIVAPDGRLLQVNHASEALLGLTVEELRERNLFQVEQLAATGVTELLQRAFAGEAVTGQPVCYVPARGPRAGETIWIETLAYPVKDDTGHVKEVVVVQADVTERRYAEDALRHTQRLQSIGVLAGGIAHDFNNMLTGILGNTSLALGVRSTEQARPFLEEVIQGVERAAQLTRELLAYAGKAQVYPQSVDLCKALPELSRLIRAAMSKKVSVQFDLERSPLIEADPAQLQQLVMNLVLNAAEAYGSETGTVVVRARCEDVTADYLRRHFATYELSPGRYVCLEVEDTGMGMDDETQRRIFDPFFTTKFLGRGLGLSAVLGIVRAHHGGLRLTSAPGAGTTFTVLLPASSIPAATTEIVPSAEGLHGSGRVLVIEDEIAIRRIVKIGLEAYGYSVTLAENGKEGLEQLERTGGQVDLVVLDIAMPVMGGEEVMREIQRLYPGLPVVIMTGLGDMDTMNQMREHGISRFMEKPFTPEHLAREVKRVLAPGGPQLNRRAARSSSK
jgi:two-component system, cell cycle sensor histidine kinase and response regulator CckA